MPTAFIDTNYLTALLYPRDTLHQKANEVSQQLNGYSFVTTELIFAETLNGLADKGHQIRLAAVSTVMALRNRLDTRVFPQTSELFGRAFDHYRARPDKSWGLVDCASFIIMDEQGITEALTHDRHFQQAGYKALLRDD